MLHKEHGFFMRYLSKLYKQLTADLFLKVRSEVVDNNCY
jgi:hypothetical protein